MKSIFILGVALSIIICRPLAVDEVEKQLNQEGTIAMQYTPHQSLRDSFPSRGSL